MWLGFGLDRWTQLISIDHVPLSHAVIFFLHLAAKGDSDWFAWLVGLAIGCNMMVVYGGGQLVQWRFPFQWSQPAASRFILTTWNIYILYLYGRLNTPTLKVACLPFFPVWFGAGLRLGKDVAQELRTVLESFSIFQQYIYIFWLHLPDALNYHRKTHPLDPDKQQSNPPCRWRIKAPHASIRLRN